MSYLSTITAPVTGEYSEKGSRFLAYGFACASAETFAEKFSELKIEHPKARHHCYAYRFGDNGEDYRVNDDGEPSGTAGLPIYNQLQSFDLSNTAVIVVRYFGGTLLGASGLIRAYKNAAQQALAQAKLTPIIPKGRFFAVTDYAGVNKLLHLCQQHDVTVLEQDFGMTCRFTLEAERSRLPEIRSAFTQAQIETALE